MSTVSSIKVKKNDGKFTELPIGVDAKNISWSGEVGLKDAIGISPYKVYETVAEMKKDAFNLSLGKCVKTLGYYKRGDGGGAEYIIDVTTAPFSEYISKTFRANLIIPANGVVSALQYGIRNDGSGYSSLLKEFLKHNKFVHALYFPRGTYTLPNEDFEIDGDIKIIGDGTESILQCQYSHKILLKGNSTIEDIRMIGGCDFISNSPKLKFKLDIYRD